LLGVIGDGYWSVLPSLTGMITGRLGPLRLYVEGGVHIFGVTGGDQETVLSMFGFAGGAGLSVRLTPAWSIGLSAQVNWLPRKLSAPVDEPREDAAKDVFYATALLTVQFTGVISRDSD
jgi:hypothetical protein